jgi:hypothetical protein
MNVSCKNVRGQVQVECQYPWLLTILSKLIAHTHSDNSIADTDCDTLLSKVSATLILAHWPLL